MKENEAIDIKDLLMLPDDRVKPGATVKMKRLSKDLGKDVFFKLRGLPYDEVLRLQRKQDEMSLYVVLNGVMEPDLRDKGLLERYDVPTPIEAIKKMFLAGEIEDLSRRIEVLSGYRTVTVEEVKKK